MPESEGLFTRPVRINLTLLGIGFLVFTVILFMEFLGNIVGILGATIIVTYLMLGPVQFLENLLAKVRIKGKNRLAPFSRTLGIILVYILLLGMLALTVFRIIPALSFQVREFAHEIPTYLQQLGVDTASQSREVPSQPLDTKIPAPASSQTQTKPERTNPAQPQTMPLRALRTSQLIERTMNLARQRILDIYMQYAARLGELILELGAATLAWVVYGLTILVMVFILLQDSKGLKKGLIGLLPFRYEASLTQFLERTHQQFHHFLRAQILNSLLVGVLMYGLLSFLDIKYALLLSVLFGVLSILPVLGPWIGLLPIIVFTGFSHHPENVVQVLLWAGGFYMLKTYWLWPKLLERKYDVHPVIFILAFMICLQIVGYSGILLSFPLASVLSVGLEYLKTHRATLDQQTHLEIS